MRPLAQGLQRRANETLLVVQTPQTACMLPARVPPLLFIPAPFRPLCKQSGRLREASGFLMRTRLLKKVSPCRLHQFDPITEHVLPVKLPSRVLYFSARLD